MARLVSRRLPGEGSIFKLADGRWAADIPAGRGPFGRRKRVRVSGKTPSIVREKKLAAERELAAGRTPKRGPTIAAWLEESWLPVVRERRLAATATGYAGTVRKYLVPQLKHVRFAELNPVDLETWYGSLRRAGVGAGTVKKIHTTLKVALRYAMRVGAAPRNAAAMIDPPAYQPKPRRRYTIEQTRAFLAAAQGHPGEALFVAALFVQMRSGELLALRWDDIDLDARTVRVQRTMTDDATGRAVVGATTKTAAGQRPIILPVIVISALRAHRERLAAGKRLGALVFPNARGKPLYRNGVLRRWLYPLQERAGLPRITFHQLRHTGASLLRELGGDLIALRDRLGHESIDTTADVYVHLDLSAQARLSDLLDAAFGSTVIDNEAIGSADGPRSGTPT